jgi:DNA-directed RNA polymerase II subunit RPB9
MSSFDELGQTHYNGVRFCQKCDNIMTPHGYIDESPEQLTFRCKNDDCNGEMVNYRNKRSLEELLLYSKEFRKAVSSQDKDLIFDPTVPRLQTPCPKCGHPEAVYYLTADRDERRLIRRLVCARVEDYTAACGHSWE